jgi:hypothetical protein
MRICFSTIVVYIYFSLMACRPVFGSWPPQFSSSNSFHFLPLTSSSYMDEGDCILLYVVLPPAAWCCTGQFPPKLPPKFYTYFTCNHKASMVWLFYTLCHLTVTCISKTKRFHHICSTTFFTGLITITLRRTFERNHSHLEYVCDISIFQYEVRYERWIEVDMIVTGPFQGNLLSCFLATSRKDWKLGSEPRFGPASCRTRHKIADFARWLVELQGFFLVTIRYERHLLEINLGLLESSCAYCDI